MIERSAADLLQFMSDEMASARVRFEIEGEFGDVDATMYEVDSTTGKEAHIADGHGDDVGEALEDLIENYNLIGAESE